MATGPQTPSPAPPAGWYRDPVDGRWARWWDGQTWAGGPPQPAPWTPAHLRYGWRLASFGQRFVAQLVDVVVLIPVWLVAFGPGTILLVAGSAQAELGDSDATAILGFVLVLLGWLVVIAFTIGYQILLEGGRYGMTVGKWVMNIAVRDVRTGGRLPYGRATTRWAIEAFLSGQLFALGDLWMLWDDENRTWHDMIADTRVIQVPTRPPLGELLRSAIRRD